MGNLDLYEKVRNVPQEAQKPIKGGNMKGFTDINPMWRIKTLTKQFGACGVGWYIEITNQWLETAADGRTAAFCNINLYVKNGDEWSKPILGTGGSMYVDFANGKQKACDECYKMAYTDALSVSCKLLGIGADVYWSKGKTKYDSSDGQNNENTNQEPKQEESTFKCSKCGRVITDIKTKNDTLPAKEAVNRSIKKFGKILCGTCAKNENK